MAKFNYIIFFPIIFILYSCSSNNSVQEENKARIIKTHTELFDNGNLAWADDIFSEEYRGEGPEIIKKFVSAIRSAFPDLEVRVEPILAEGDMVAFRRTMAGTHKGEFMGFSPSGKRIEWETIIISHVKDLKVIEEWGVSNLYEKLAIENLSME